MKITGVRTHLLTTQWIDDPSFPNSAHSTAIIRIETDGNLDGLGECTWGYFAPDAVPAMVAYFAPVLIGRDPLQILEVTRAICDDSVWWARSGAGRSVISGIELALWDLKGKALGVPVWQLLGGKVRDKVRVYTHLMRGAVGFQVPNTEIAAYCDAVQQTVEMGYDAVKLGFVPINGYDAPIKAVRHVEKLAQAVRQRVGEGVDIMVDFHGRPDSLDAAIAYVNAIAPIKPLFCEEVIQPGDARAMADIARRVDCPLATGERLFTPREFAEIAECRAVAYIQPDLAHCLGLSGGRKIAAIAEAAHMGVCPHNPMGPVAGAVALHFDVATTNFVIQEEAVGIVPWFEEICSVHPMRLKDHSWAVPDAPGLGIEIDEAAAAKHPFQQEVIPAATSILADGRIANW